MEFLTHIAAAEERVRAELTRHAPREVYTRLLAANDALIRSDRLDHGREITAGRTALHTELVAHWIAAQHRAFGYDRPFALVALGGTGRAEVTPGSDTDFALLFDDQLDQNPFLLHLKQRLLHTAAFAEEYGFNCHVLQYNLDDALRLDGMQLNSFLDLRPLYDPDGLAGRFRERIRGTFDPFEHFLHLRRYWKEEWEPAARQWERLDQFDIKNHGLRVFLAGIWTLAGPAFQPCHEIYAALEDDRPLEAYEFLLRIRCFVHDRRARLRTGRTTDHDQDLLGFDDFNALGELKGPEAGELERFAYAGEVRQRLLSARRRVARFSRTVIERDLQKGREISRGSPLVFGVSGLHYPVSPANLPFRERSRAALGLVLAAQHYGVPIDPAELERTFHNAGDWLVPVPELSALFYEPAGSLAESFAFLSQVDGAEDRLFPGYARFEASFDARVMKEQQLVRSALERQKTRVLESWVREGRERLARAVSAERTAQVLEGVSIPLEAARLDPDHLAAVKLALKTKRLPVTADDATILDDPGRPLHERYSSGMSGVPLAEYYEPYRTACEFSAETLRVTRFLVEHRRAFKERAEGDLNPESLVNQFASLCRDEQTLRALFVFTCADRSEWESEVDEPTRWFNTRELYAKAMMRFRPDLNPKRSLETGGFAPEELEVLRDFGPDFYNGVYGRYASRFGAHLVRLAEEPGLDAVKVIILHEGTATIVGVAARDYRGLAAAITGALWQAGIRLRQAHLFSAMNHGLALDFFHVVPGGIRLGPDTARALERAIQDRRAIADGAEAALPDVPGTASLQDWSPGQYCLRFESEVDADGLIYALTYKVFRYLEGNIFGLAAHNRRGRAFVSVYLSLPAERTADEARRIVRERF